MRIAKLSTRLAALVLAASVQVGRGDPKDAVVRIPSHGGSGTVIATGEGWSLILSCGHCFPGADARKPISLDVPVPAAKAPASRVGVTLLAVNAPDDLSLLRLNFGPLPYVSPVAPKGFRPGRCLSVGYDEMRLPPQVRPCDIVRVDAQTTWTKQRPWHGRSGGGLIDEKTGWLVGVCSGYTGPKNRVENYPGGNGIYVSHAAILRFLHKAGYGVIQDGNPDALREEHMPEREASPGTSPLRPSPSPRPPLIFERRLAPPCPWGH